MVSTSFPAKSAAKLFGGFRSMGAVVVFCAGTSIVISFWQARPRRRQLLPRGAHMVDAGDEGAEPGASRDNVWEPLLRDAAQRAATPPLLDAAWDPLTAAVATKQADAQQAQVRQRGS